jgi:hypothetical protein
MQTKYQKGLKKIKKHDKIKSNHSKGDEKHGIADRE